MSSLPSNYAVSYPVPSLISSLLMMLVRITIHLCLLILDMLEHETQPPDRTVQVLTLTIWE